MAKNGQEELSRDEMDHMLVQVVGYDLPNTMRQTVGLWDLLEFEDRSFFKDTVEASHDHLNKMSGDIDIEIKNYNNNPSPQAKITLKDRIDNIVKGAQKYTSVLV